MEPTTPSLQAIALRIFLTLFFIFILSFLYVYLSALNPIVYLNVIMWWFLGALLIIPVVLFSPNNNTSKIIASLVISAVTVYVVYGMKSSIFFNTAMSSIINNGSMWPPKVKFGDLFNTLLSFTEYKTKLNFLLKFDNANITYRGKGGDMGSGFTVFFRVIECAGIFVIPIYQMFKPKK